MHHLKDKEKNRILATLISLILFGASSGCAIDNPGIDPPRNAFYFPAGIALDAEHSLLYVANSNADLRYNGGTLMALDISALPSDLSQIKERVAAHTLDCRVDRIDSTRWECPVSSFVIDESVVRIGNLPNQIALSNDKKRLFLPIRGEHPEDHLLWVDRVDLGGGRIDLRCNDNCKAGEDCREFDCDDRHRVRYLAKRDDYLPHEPFGILTDYQPDLNEDWAFLTHLEDGEVSFFVSTPDGDVELRDVEGTLFPTVGDNSEGATALALQYPGTLTQSSIFAASRDEARIVSFAIRDQNKIIKDGELAMSGASPGETIRGIDFSFDGQTLYAISLEPPSMISIDMNEDNDALGKRAKWMVEVGAQPSLIHVAPHPESDDPNAAYIYVVCYGEGAIFVVDSVKERLVDIITTGVGPNQIVFDHANKRAFITNFAENTVGVIDLDPTHPGFHKMILRIGLRKNLITNS